MLESLADKMIREPVSQPFLALPPARSCSFRAAFRQSPDGRAFELSGGVKSRLLSPVKGIAEHLGHCVVSAQKVHLETVCLFFRARLGVDAPDIRF
jgi:hypothetical protein